METLGKEAEGLVSVTVGGCAANIKSQFTNSHWHNKLEATHRTWNMRDLTDVNVFNVVHRNELA